MADLKFEVDSSEVSRAVDELIRMGKASKDTAKAFEQGFRKVVSWQERFQSEQGRINATLEKNYRAQTLSNKSARESAAIFQQLDAEVSKAAASYSQLKAAIDPVYAAQMRMKKGHDAIRAALKAGVITRAEAAQSLRAYRTEVRSLSQAQMAATKSSNRMGVVTQQAGYQIGDFLVQVQSGTSPFVAFGQQATQLVGILPLMTGAFGLSTTALIGLSAGLGIAIPLVTAIGAAFMRSSGSAETLLQSLDKLEETNNNLRTFGEAFGVNLVGNIEAVRESFGNLVADVYEAQLNQVQGKLSSAFGRGFLSESFAASYTSIKPSELSGFNQEQLKEQAQQELAIQEQINNIIGQTITSKSQLNGLFSEAYDNLVASDAISEDGLKRLREIAIQNGVVLGVEQDRVDLARNLGEQLVSHVELYQDYIDKQKKARDNLAEEIIARHNNLILLEIERQSGKDSVTYRAELVRQEQERLQALYGQDEAAQALVEEALALYKETIKVNAEMDASADSAKGLADALKEAASAMSSLSSFGEGLDKAIAVAAAKVNALKTGADEAVAGRIAGLRSDLEVKLSADGLKPEAAVDLRSEFESKIATLEGLLSEGSGLRGDSRGSSGGQTKDDPLKTLQDRIALEQELLGKTEAQQRVIQALGLDWESYGASTIQGITETIEEMDKLNQKAAEQEQISKTIESSMSSAFMSMVDGTKSVSDAFKDMARAIIAELYQIYVVKKITGMITGAIGGAMAGPVQGPNLPSSVMANGGVWSGGSQVKAFADGGVVGGPTTFPMAGGKTGLMGEAGPEAIMPLKRGANGKLGVQMEGGSQGNVVVNQSFNFSANGDDSVKKLIAQAAPQIANMTQKQIMDSRRRGGALKSTFG